MSTLLAFANRHKHKEKPNTKSGYKGVYCMKKGANGKPLTKPYKAYIRHQAQYICIGYYKTAEEAALAYNKEARCLKGQGTWLNTIS